MTMRNRTENELPRKDRAVGYIRVNSKDQLDGYSIDAQKATIRDRNDQGDWDLQEIYVDEGLSAFGKKSRARPGFRRMMEDAKAGRFEVLIVDRTDRFGRESGHSFEAMETLNRLGITFMSVQDPVDITNGMDRLSIEMNTLFSEQWSSIISERVKESIRNKTSQGKAWGRPPYGYQMCDNRCPSDDDSHRYWHLHDTKAPAVREMFELYDSGEYSTAGIADWLNEHDYRTNGSAVDMQGAEIEGNPFTSHAVSAILKNSRYIGIIKDATTTTGERLGFHMPIVDKDLFDRVQKRLKKNTVGRFADNTYKENAMEMKMTHTQANVEVGKTRASAGN